MLIRTLTINEIMCVAGGRKKQVRHSVNKNSYFSSWSTQKYLLLGGSLASLGIAYLLSSKQPGSWYDFRHPPSPISDGLYHPEPMRGGTKYWWVTCPTYFSFLFEAGGVVGVFKAFDLI